LVKATYYNEDGSISSQGFFKDKKLTGEWVRFDQKGEKTQVGYYKEGKKVGVWSFWKKDMLRQVSYNDNTIVSVQTKKLENITIADN
jgi:antitoxin component YwqK of YwqJK toxin-antitoxin module